MIMLTKKQLRTRIIVNKRAYNRFQKGKPKFDDWYRCYLCGRPHYKPSPFPEYDELDNHITVSNKKKGSWHYIHISCHKKMLELVFGEGNV